MERIHIERKETRRCILCPPKRVFRRGSHSEQILLWILARETYFWLSEFYYSLLYSNTITYDILMYSFNLKLPGDRALLGIISGFVLMIYNIK
jgi:hypothetical protein